VLEAGADALLDLAMSDERRSMPASNHTGRATRPLSSRSMAMSARRKVSGMRTSPAAADAIPRKARPG
jgi:hypothetical protein